MNHQDLDATTASGNEVSIYKPQVSASDKRSAKPSKVVTADKTNEPQRNQPVRTQPQKEQPVRTEPQNKQPEQMNHREANQRELNHQKSSQ